MKRIVLGCLLLLSVSLLLSGCFFKEAAPPPEALAPAQPIDWSGIKLPETGDEGGWMTCPGRLNCGVIGFCDCPKASIPEPKADADVAAAVSAPAFLIKSRRLIVLSDICPHLRMRHNGGEALTPGGESY